MVQLIVHIIGRVCKCIFHRCASNDQAELRGLAGEGQGSRQFQPGGRHQPIIVNIFGCLIQFKLKGTNNANLFHGRTGWAIII
jgi:hypothetical protein